MFSLATFRHIFFHKKNIKVVVGTTSSGAGASTENLERVRKTESCELLS